MTAEELALLGYPATQQDQSTAPAITGGDLSALNAPVGSAPIQPGNALAAPGIDAASLAAMSGPVPSAVTESMYPDQAGYPISQTTPQPTSGSGPDGSVAMGDPSIAAQRQQQPQLTAWQQYLSERGIGPNSVVDMASHRELLKGFNALQLKQLELQDPEKKLKLQQMQHEISTQGMKDQNLQGELAAQQRAAINAGQEQIDKYNTKQSALDQVDDSISKIQALIDHPGRAWISGGTSVLPNAPGSSGADAQALYDQVKNQAFLAGRDKLRGTGSLSDMESKAAGSAATRLTTRQSEPEFLKTLEEMKGILATGRTRLSDQIKTMPKPLNYADNVQAQTASNAPAPILRTTARGTFRSIGNGQWVQIK